MSRCLCLAPGTASFRAAPIVGCRNKFLEKAEQCFEILTTHAKVFEEGFVITMDEVACHSRASPLSICTLYPGVHRDRPSCDAKSSMRYTAALRLFSMRRFTRAIAPSSWRRRCRARIQETSAITKADRVVPYSIVHGTAYCVSTWCRA